MPPGQLLHIDDLTDESCVAVWIGSFQNSKVADHYMTRDRGFERDFGLKLSERRCPELTVRPQAAPISELVAGFSCSDDYADAVVQAAQSIGISEATSMLVFLWVRFAPERTTVNPNAPLRFLGNFSFEGFK